MSNDLEIYKSIDTEMSVLESKVINALQDTDKFKKILSKVKLNTKNLFILPVVIHLDRTFRYEDKGHNINGKMIQVKKYYTQLYIEIGNTSIVSNKIEDFDDVDITNYFEIKAKEIVKSIKNELKNQKLLKLFDKTPIQINKNNLSRIEIDLITSFSFERDILIKSAKKNQIAKYILEELLQVDYIGDLEHRPIRPLTEVFEDYIDNGNFELELNEFFNFIKEDSFNLTISCFYGKSRDRETDEWDEFTQISVGTKPYIDVIYFNYINDILYKTYYHIYPSSAENKTKLMEEFNESIDLIDKELHRLGLTAKKVGIEDANGTTFDGGAKVIINISKNV